MKEEEGKKKMGGSFPSIYPSLFLDRFGKVRLYCKQDAAASSLDRLKILSLLLDGPTLLPPAEFRIPFHLG